MQQKHIILIVLGLFAVLSFVGSGVCVMVNPAAAFGLMLLALMAGATFVYIVRDKSY